MQGSQYIARSLALATCWTILAIAVPAHAQVPIGDEIQVNTLSDYMPQNPSVSSDTGGRFIVVWANDSDSSVRGRRLDWLGNPIDTDEFTITDTTVWNQLFPDVSMNASGEFVVIWQEDDEIWGRRYANTGSPHEPAYKMSHDPPTGSFWGYSDPAVAMNGSGGFLAAYTHNSSDGGGTWVRAFSPSGTASGDGVQFKDFGYEDLVSNDIAVTPTGPGMLAWHWDYPYSVDLNEVAVRPSSVDGVPLGPEVVLNPDSTVTQSNPFIAHLEAGGWVVAWTRNGFALAQLLDASGTPLEPIIDVGDFEVTSVAALHNGGFVVVGEQYGRLFSAEGIAAGPSFELRDGDPLFKAQVTAITGGFVVVGEAQQPVKKQLSGMVAQRFRMLPGPDFEFLPERGLPNSPPTMGLLETGILASCEPIDIDGDGELEIIVEDIGRTAGQVLVRNGGDGDGDPDIIFVGVDTGGSFVGTTDIDGDGEQEALVTDPGLTLNTVLSRGAGDGDGDPDVVFISTIGGGAIIGDRDLDGDGEPEVVVTAPSFTATSVTSRGAGDGDGDPDVIFVGTTVGARGLFGDLDMDGETDVVVECASGSVGVVSRGAGDGDGDADVIVVTGGPLLAGLVDLDGDQEVEVVLDDPTRTAGTVAGYGAGDGDGDPDVVLVGTDSGGAAVALADIDKDCEYELIVENPSGTNHGVTTQGVDGDGDLDVVFVSTPAGGAVIGHLDTDDDDEVEVIVLDGDDSLGIPFFQGTDGDGDEDVVFFGGGDAVPAFAVDLDDSGEAEIVLSSETLTAGTYSVYDLHGGTAIDILIVGIQGGGGISSVLDWQGTQRYGLVVEAEALDASTIIGSDLPDDDPDIDIIFVATPNGGAVVAASDIDDNGDGELIVNDPNLAIGSYQLRSLSGSEPEVAFIGAGTTGRVALTADIDGDGEWEVVVEDSAGYDIQVTTYSMGDGDGDPDILRVGTPSGGTIAGLSDLDGDDEHEVVVANAERPPTSVIGRSAGDGDGDPDVTFIGVEGGATVVGAADLDHDGEREVVVEDPAAAGGSIRLRSAGDGDGDTDVVFAGTGGASLITVLVPNEHVVWQAGSSQEISWEAPTLAGEVKLSLSRDGGEVFEELVASTANDGSWTWPVSEPITDAAVIRVESATSSAVFDDSDETFEIVPDPFIFEDGFESGDTSSWSSVTP